MPNCSLLHLHSNGMDVVLRKVIGTDITECVYNNDNKTDMLD